MSERFNIQVYRGQSALLTAYPMDSVARQAIVVDVSGWLMRFTLFDYVSGNALITKTTGGGGIVGYTSGVITVTILASDLTIPVNNYIADIWRIDSGSEDPLAVGTIQVLQDARVR